ncbi:hypothetical protein ACFQPA_01575 [Halomarina halobia]|uniref:Small CPxCG-related zinc finger protein n=1 Tax=Halomarina halobia TaxID=3033386 RepID=A0ABD6A785_9EURY|nr:hypothetical protein [Halomarina sp. PSR21]
MATTHETETPTGGELRDPTTLPPQRECVRCGGDRFHVFGRDGERPQFVCPACGVRLDTNQSETDATERTTSNDRTLLADVLPAFALLRKWRE